MAYSFNLDGKIVFITGSTRGIGWAIAKAFAANGASVILNSKSNKELLAQRANELEKEFSVRAMGILFDVTNHTETTKCYQTIFGTFGGLDVLVNNAGILQNGLLGMITPEMARQALEVNALAPLLHTQEASRLMGRKKSGSIINLASIMGTNGEVGQTAYATSKAAVIGLTKAAAKELAPKGIRVNALSPGFIDTEMTQGLTPEKYDERKKSIKIGRVGAAEDVAHAALFLGSNLSDYITGQVIGVDGGMLI